MLRLAAVVLVAACSTTRSSPAIAPPETSSAPLFLGDALYDEPDGPEASFETHEEVDDEAAAPPVSEAVRGHPIAAACPFAWDQLVAPSVIRLHTWNTGAPHLPDDCPEIEPDELFASCAAPDCASGTMARGRRAVLAIDGPNGSGRFTALGLVVDDGTLRRFACMTASTVAWRHLHRVATMLAPLPWLADVGGDTHRELVVWQRLAWDDYEGANAMVPIVYVLEGNALVRADVRGIAIAAKLAAAYRQLARTAAQDDPIKCYRAAAHVLDNWAR